MSGCNVSYAYHGNSLLHNFHIAQKKWKFDSSKLDVDFEFLHQKITNHLRQNPTMQNVVDIW